MSSRPRERDRERQREHYLERRPADPMDPAAALPPFQPSGPEDMPEADDANRLFLQTPESRLRELWRVVKIGAEFIRGFRRLHFVGPCVTVFGSARVPEGDPVYDLARQVGRELARVGFTVMTGGGPGLMEAANRGARDVGGRSVGSNIVLVEYEAPNAFLDTWVPFRYFFVRKVMLLRYSYAFIYLPGGLGTLDEVFETATLIQTKKIKAFPLILMGSDYWAPLLEFLAGLVEQGKMVQEDLDRFIVTDDPEEAAAICRDAAIRRFGLAYKRPRPRRWWLWE